MKKPKRNFKIFNHFVAEVRDLASKKRPKLKVEVAPGEYKPLTKSGLHYLFQKSSLKDSFIEGLTPSDALEAELECWEEAQPD